MARVPGALVDTLLISRAILSKVTESKIDKGHEGSKVLIVGTSKIPNRSKIPFLFKLKKYYILSQIPLGFFQRKKGKKTNPKLFFTYSYSVLCLEGGCNSAWKYLMCGNTLF